MTSNVNWNQTGLNVVREEKFQFPSAMNHRALPGRIRIAPWRNRLVQDPRHYRTVPGVSHRQAKLFYNEILRELSAAPFSDTFHIGRGQLRPGSADSQPPVCAIVPGTQPEH